MSRRSSGHRARTTGRRLDPTVLVALPAVLLAAAGVALAGSGPGSPAPLRPEEAPLSRVTVVCPSAQGAEIGPGLLSSDSGRRVEVQVARGDDTESLALPRNQTVEAPGPGPLVVEGDGPAATGLVAGRFAAPLSAAECGPPVADQWFTGLGAGARHRSTLELVNPDSGRAIVDVVVRGRSGVVEADDLRGIAVPGRSSVRIALADTLPRRDELALRVSANRGRISASVLDEFDRLGSAPNTQGWLPAQPAPTTSELLLGLPDQARGRRLLIANPSDSEVRTSLQVVTEDAVLSPEGAEDVTVPADSVVRVSVDEVLSSAAAQGAVGVLLESTAPVTSALRAFVGDDLVHAVSGTELGGPVDVLVPGGSGADKKLVLAAASGVGTVSLVARSAGGEVLARRRVEVVDGRGYAVGLPDGTRRLTVEPRRARISGTVTVSGDGATGVRLREPVRSELVAGVRPGLP